MNRADMEALERTFKAREAALKALSEADAEIWRLVHESLREALAKPKEAPRTIQQTLPLGKPKRQPSYRKGLQVLAKTVLAEKGGWMTFDEILKEVRRRDPGWTQIQLREAMGNLSRSGEVERYPPVVEGRRLRKESCEYRLKEAGE
ncbi:MAG: hypothetical protein IKP53_08460 [Candidatus Methanomethylophilaceae archaeon]|nr:hypothetical protein [Candidatus Methanomethylophilaceae archaeon]